MEREKESSWLLWCLCQSKVEERACVNKNALCESCIVYDEDKIGKYKVQVCSVRGRNTTILPLQWVCMKKKLTIGKESNEQQRKKKHKGWGRETKEQSTVPREAACSVTRRMCVAGWTSSGADCEARAVAEVEDVVERVLLRPKRDVAGASAAEAEQRRGRASAAGAEERRGRAGAAGAEKRRGRASAAGAEERRGRASAAGAEERRGRATAAEAEERRGRASCCGRRGSGPGELLRPKEVEAGRGAAEAVVEKSSRPIERVDVAEGLVERGRRSPMS